MKFFTTDDDVLFQTRLHLCRLYKDRGSLAALERWNSSAFWQIGYLITTTTTITPFLGSNP